jgi:glycerol-3-phosphate dehydrogenase subunit B
MTTRNTPRYDLAVIGTGIAGLAAAVCAANRGLKVVQAGNTGAISYTSGVFDVLGAIPPAGEGRAEVVERPFAAIPRLLEAAPGHPYSLVAPEDIRSSIHEVMEFLRGAGVAYRAGGDDNFNVIGPAGTLKHSWCVPETMLGGSEAFAAKAPCVVVGVERLKGFSAAQVAANLRGVWPGLRAERVALPGHPGGEVYTEQAARMLEVPRTREAFAEALRPLVGDARYVGLPAILGMHRPGDVAADLSRLLGATVFEIPTMPPGVPGIRLKEAFEDKLPEMGVDLYCQQRMDGELPGGDEPFALRISGQPIELEVKADHVVLASGRFLGGGLRGTLERIEETVFGLPVDQPESRAGWHREDYLDPRGHAVHRAGLRTDERLRPLDASGQVLHPRLFAAGSILAHQDWIRMKCGAGVAIATAAAAVDAVAKSAGAKG